MTMHIYQFLIYILIWTTPTRSYPGGAPASTCLSMAPSHIGVSSQQCSSKYNIIADKQQYYSNETVRITVSGTSGDPFKGILLIAKSQSNDRILGTWTIVNSNIQTLACGGVPNTGITHNSASDKSSIQAIWHPPQMGTQETTLIKATMVTSFREIYVSCFSIILTPASTIPNTNNNTSTTQTAIIDTTTPGTENSTTGAEVSWTYANGVTSVTMKVNNLQSSQWMALGLSLDDEMGEDHVFVCKRSAGDAISAERRINPSGTSPPVLSNQISNAGGTFTVTRTKLENNVVYCEFTLSNFSNGKRKRRAIGSLSQSQSYYPLIAMGKLDGSNELQRHTLRLALSETVQLNRQEKISFNQDSSSLMLERLMKAHGIIMIFTWILLVPIGILLARYFKSTWSNKKLCGESVWFACHRILMCSVVILTFIAFILIIFSQEGKWVSIDDKTEFAHSIFGIIVICFAIIQPIMALFRCHPGERYRFIFNYTHAAIGFTAFLFSIITIFLAIFFDQFNFRAKKVWIILLIWVCWVVVIFIIFTIIDMYNKRHVPNERDQRPRSMELEPTVDAKAQKNNSTGKNTTIDRVKTILLVIHIIIALALSIALAAFVGNA